MESNMITTANELPGHTIIRNLGVVRGITVRSRSIVGNIAGGIQSLLCYGTAVVVEPVR